MEPRLFGALNAHMGCVLDLSRSDEERGAALNDLKEALSRLTPQGRPPEITNEDVARDWPLIQTMYDQFQALIDAHHPPNTYAAERVVKCIQHAKAGDQKARELVDRLAPLFLRNPLELFPSEFDRMLKALAQIQRPRGRVNTFAAHILSVKYGVDRRTAVLALRKMRSRPQ